MQQKQVCRLYPTFRTDQYPRINPDLPPLDVITNQFAIATPGDRFVWLREDWTSELQYSDPFTFGVNEEWRGETKDPFSPPPSSLKKGLQPIAILDFVLDFFCARNLFLYCTKEKDALTPKALLGYKNATEEKVATLAKSYDYFYEYGRKTRGSEVLQWEAIPVSRKELRDYYLPQEGGLLAAQIVGDEDSDIQVEYPIDRLTAIKLCDWFITSLGYAFLSQLPDGSHRPSEVMEVVEMIEGLSLDQVIDRIGDLQPIAF